MSVDVPGPQDLRQQREQGALRPVGAEVDHDRTIGNVSGEHSLFKRLPATSGIVCALDPYQHVRIFLEHGRGGMAIHIVVVVFVEGAAHARTDDVEKSQHARVASDR